MQQNSHLRQRHGSDALRLDPVFDDQTQTQVTNSRRPHSRSQSHSQPTSQSHSTRHSPASASPNNVATPPSSSASSSSNNPATLHKIATNFEFPARDLKSAQPRASRAARSSSIQNVGLDSTTRPTLLRSYSQKNSYSHGPPSPLYEQDSPNDYEKPSPATRLMIPVPDLGYSRSGPGSGALPDGASTPNSTTPINSANQTGSYPPSAPTWRNMPHKDQLAILALSRFVDFFQMASLQTYMVHQLKSFDPSLPNTVISHQAGVLQGSFTASQIVTSILWGRAADQPGVGRKLVLMIGLVGTAISMLGVGFSSTYQQAVFWRIVGGAINGTVGAARTMVAETVDKRWHPRAFLLLPAAFNIANVAGPILGGLLVEPITAYPNMFGPESTIGGARGVVWMRKYPYALANSLSTILLLAEALLVHYYLRETLKGFRKVDYSLFNPSLVFRGCLRQLRRFRRRGTRVFGESSMLKRGLMSGREDGSIELDRMANDPDDMMDENEKGQSRPVQRLPFSRIWTSNVLWTLLTIAIFDFHMGAFNNLWTLFLSTNRAYVPNSQLRMPGVPMTDDHDPGQHDGKGHRRLAHRALTVLVSRSASDTMHHPRRSIFKFTGGLAFPPTTIGFAMAIIGFVGVLLQFLLYPWANARFGLMRCFRMSLFFFPLAYFLAPYITLLPSRDPSPSPASGFWVWMGISFVILLQVAARTFALPASIILLNNSSPHPSVLATIHGLGQADSATFRTLGPILSGSWYGTWYERGVVGMSWWFVAAISALGCVASFYVRNGSGHEILLPGEDDKDDDDDDDLPSQATATAAAASTSAAGASASPHIGSRNNTN